MQTPSPRFFSIENKKRFSINVIHSKNRISGEIKLSKKSIFEEYFLIELGGADKLLRSTNCVFKCHRNLLVAGILFITRKHVCFVNTSASSSCHKIIMDISTLTNISNDGKNLFIQIYKFKFNDTDTLQEVEELIKLLMNSQTQSFQNKEKKCKEDNLSPAEINYKRRCSELENQVEQLQYLLTTEVKKQQLIRHDFLAFSLDAKKMIVELQSKLNQLDIPNTVTKRGLATGRKARSQSTYITLPNHSSKKSVGPLGINTPILASPRYQRSGSTTFTKYVDPSDSPTKCNPKINPSPNQSPNKTHKTKPPKIIVPDDEYSTVGDSLSPKERRNTLGYQMMVSKLSRTVLKRESESSLAKRRRPTRPKKSFSTTKIGNKLNQPNSSENNKSTRASSLNVKTNLLGFTIEEDNSIVGGGAINSTDNKQVVLTTDRKLSRKRRNIEKSALDQEASEGGLIPLSPSDLNPVSSSFSTIKSNDYSTLQNPQIPTLKVNFISIPSDDQISQSLSTATSGSDDIQSTSDQSQSKANPTQPNTSDCRLDDNLVVVVSEKEKLIS